MFSPLDEEPVPLPTSSSPVTAAPATSQAPPPVSAIPRKIPQNIAVKLPQASAATKHLKPAVKPAFLLHSNDRHKQLENARKAVQQRNLEQPRSEQAQSERPTATSTPEQLATASKEPAKENPEAGVMQRFKGFVGGWL